MSCGNNKKINFSQMTYIDAKNRWSVNPDVSSEGLFDSVCFWLNSFYSLLSWNLSVQFSRKSILSSHQMLTTNLQSWSQATYFLCSDMFQKQAVSQAGIFHLPCCIICMWVEIVPRFSLILKRIWFTDWSCQYLGFRFCPWHFSHLWGGFNEQVKTC